MASSHPERVQEIAAQVKARPAGRRVTIRKATPSHSIRDAAYKNGCHAIDVSALCEILSIDATRRRATAEGQVVMQDLARATLAHGLLPAVVPEFRKFTVAGLISGEGIQSSSHRYGCFTHTVRSVELLLADGSIADASEASNPDLFAVLPESLGTLGIVTAATIDLVPARPRVKTTYRAFSSRQDYLAAFRDTLGSCAFHEGVIFGPRLHVLITADFIDETDARPTYHPDRPGEPYFYQHVRATATVDRVTHDVIDTLAYLSRSERGFWWLMECNADFPLLSETAWGRRLLDKGGADMYERSGLGASGTTTLERDRCLINQDMGVTVERLGDGIEWVTRRLGVYPIWNCAVRLPDQQRAERGTAYYVDIGLYGEPTVGGYRHVRDMRALQQFADAPSLWGTSYLTWDELRATNPRRFETYERVRGEVGAEAAFLHIKDKVVWVDPSQPDAGAIPLWRLRRSFGRRWYLNPLVYPLLALVMLSKLIWRRPALT